MFETPPNILIRDFRLKIDIPTLGGTLRCTDRSNVRSTHRWRQGSHAQLIFFQFVKFEILWQVPAWQSPSGQWNWRLIPMYWSVKRPDVILLEARVPWKTKAEIPPIGWDFYSQHSGGQSREQMIWQRRHSTFVKNHFIWKHERGMSDPTQQ